MATLTGAAKTALGNDYHALFSFDDELAESPAGQRRGGKRTVLASAAGRVPPQPAAVQLCRAEQHRQRGVPGGRKHRGRLPVALR